MRANIPICKNEVYSDTVNCIIWDLYEIYFGLWVEHIIGV